MNSALKGLRDSPGGTYNVKVYNGGNAICGPGASANISRKYHKSSCGGARHHHKAICYPFENYNKPEKLQGPEQRLTDIPAKVYQKLEVQLSDGQSDCKTLACQIFPNIRQDEIEYLTTKYPTNKAKGIFKKMSEKGITVGQLVDALMSIERQDAIETLIEAGYPKESDTTENDETVEEDSSLTDEEALDEMREEIPEEKVCFEQNSYRVFIEEPAPMRVKEDANSPSVIRNLMSRVCLIQLPTTPEETFTGPVSALFGDIQRE